MARAVQHLQSLPVAPRLYAFTSLWRFHLTTSLAGTWVRPMPLEIKTAQVDPALNAAAPAKFATPLADGLKRKRLQTAVKRAFDFVAAALGLIVLAPVFAAAALVIRLTSPGPVFFCQPREGYRGRQFVIWKFRSMHVRHDDATTAAQRTAAALGKLIKVENDPRVTVVGRWLRATSVDELPQLFNVLKGEMSLIGPRPLLAFMLEPYPEFRRTRALVRPGITGLWQIRDRANNTSALSMMSHDHTS